MVLTIIVGVVVGWFMLALAVAMLVGRAVALADRDYRRTMSRRRVAEPADRLMEVVA